MAETSDAAAKTASVVVTCKVARVEDIGADGGVGDVTMGDEDIIDKVEGPCVYLAKPKISFCFCFDILSILDGGTMCFHGEA
ncbi:hypothetical protein E3N88_28745 [Mikania micrantha]|uniref:Uncharacterized protein n=1 Tax=Mikania micrantha TaxID=192012 RepID=A0A5N6N1Y7_9ASTR|nr:hypothetical protein E3N88_28745 [Mikania micrantha]